MTTRLRRRSSFSRSSLEAEEEEKVVVPFPTLIKVEKKERKPILDLMEAIRQVKVSVKVFPFLFGFRENVDNMS